MPSAKDDQVRDIELFDPDALDDGDTAIREYDIVSSPNDFNVLSYFNFIESGAIQIPGFQRHYVWDIRKASKLIESILMGLPIPQLFLYEEGKNTFLVIDGQQRLMTLYYFMKGRFPKRDARAEIRALFASKGKLDPRDLEDDRLFVNFRLSFSEHDEHRSPYSGLTYHSLQELRTTFELRTIRNIMVKQVRPDDDHSSIFELFHRLNTGGVNLSQQEIRMSLFHGPFVEMASKLNELRAWRTILGGNPDQRQRDVEIILRMFALAELHEQFKKPLSKFINMYCSSRKQIGIADDVHAGVFEIFCNNIARLSRDLYLEPKLKRVSVPVLESVFVAAAGRALVSHDVDQMRQVSRSHLKSLLDHPDFDRYFTGKTTDASAVKGRIAVAAGILK